MAIINIVLQGKGGVGKSLISSLMAQYLIDRNQLLASFDTDPVNATFAGYKAIDAVPLELIEDDNINSRLFDNLIEKLVGLPENARVVIDSGASTFIPLSSYLSENNVPQFFSETGHQLVLHTIIAGGQAETDTVQGLNSLLTCFAGIPITVWVNPFFGQVDFTQKHELAKKNAKNGGIIISLPSYKKETFGHDLETILKNRLTFDEALESAELNIMAKQRLKIIRDDIYTLLDGAGLIDEIQDTATDS